MIAHAGSQAMPSSSIRYQSFFSLRDRVVVYFPFSLLFSLVIIYIQFSSSNLHILLVLSSERGCVVPQDISLLLSGRWNLILLFSFILLCILVFKQKAVPPTFSKSVSVFPTSTKLNYTPERWALHYISRLLST